MYAPVHSQRSVSRGAVAVLTCAHSLSHVVAAPGARHARSRRRSARVKALEEAATVDAGAATPAPSHTRRKRGRDTSTTGGAARGPRQGAAKKQRQRASTKPSLAAAPAPEPTAAQASRHAPPAAKPAPTSKATKKPKATRKGKGKGAGKGKGKAAVPALTPSAERKPRSVKHLLFVFAHGAGAGQSSEWMRVWSDRLGDLGDVHAFDYPYMKAGGRPPRAEKNIVPHWEEVVQAQAAYREEHGREPFTVLIGKSMGSRIGCHVAAEDPNIADAVVCLGYPLVGMNGKLRDEVLKALRVPTLLCQGTRDKMSPAAQLATVARETSKRGGGAGVVDVEVVEAGDHGLRLTVKRRKELGMTQEEADDALLARIHTWLTSIAEK